MAQTSSPALSDLIFPTTANHNFSHILTDLKRSNLSIANRLRSIAQDAEFGGRRVLRRAAPRRQRALRELVHPPEDKRASAYFKSTDGHTNAWKFSTRRLNLHLLELIGKHDGNARRAEQDHPGLVHRHQHGPLPRPPPRGPPLHPPNVVSASEHSQIAALLPSFLASLRALDIDPAPLRARLAKPLRPFWVTQETQLSPVGDVFDDHHPVVCCTASRRVAGAEMSEAGYIQGAGDDTENWALGLTADVFWDNAGALLAAPEADLPDTVARLVAERKHNAPRGVPPKQVAPRILVCPLPWTTTATTTRRPGAGSPSRRTSRRGSRG
ncbi:LOW QUALITY PROTEIN: tRNA A64-2'-O-ribosylphosphate transferase [Colletotrichum tofieldiae]|nr:LOW QUALITY PROTEIN: tRNA A64-2'-O-ribosylphosphate transferase [Colletotrichum tofieldiae]